MACHPVTDDPALKTDRRSASSLTARVLRLERRLRDSAEAVHRIYRTRRIHSLAEIQRWRGPELEERCLFALWASPENQRSLVLCQIELAARGRPVGWRLYEH